MRRLLLPLLLLTVGCSKPADRPVVMRKLAEIAHFLATESQVLPQNYLSRCTEIIGVAQSPEIQTWLKGMAALGLLPKEGA